MDFQYKKLRTYKTSLSKDLTYEKFENDAYYHRGRWETNNSIDDSRIHRRNIL